MGRNSHKSSWVSPDRINVSAYVEILFNDHTEQRTCRQRKDVLQGRRAREEEKTAKKGRTLGRKMAHGGGSFTLGSQQEGGEKKTVKTTFCEKHGTMKHKAPRWSQVELA